MEPLEQKTQQKTLEQKKQEVEQNLSATIQTAAKKVTLGNQVLHPRRTRNLSISLGEGHDLLDRMKESNSLFSALSPTSQSWFLQWHVEEPCKDATKQLKDASSQLTSPRKPATPPNRRQSASSFSFSDLFRRIFKKDKS